VMLGDNGSRTSCGYAMLLIYLLNVLPFSQIPSDHSDIEM